MTLRPYQQQAVDGVFEAWRSTSSCLVVMSTGTGKTHVFAHVIARMPPGRAIVNADAQSRPGTGQTTGQERATIAARSGCYD